MRDRVLFDNPELIARYVEQKCSVLLLTAHMCNWEWLLPAGGAQFGFPIDTVYKPDQGRGARRVRAPGAQPLRRQADPDSAASCSS